MVNKHILCSEEVHKAIKILAARKDVSMSDVIKELLEKTKNI
jgi:predicted CopG family antitoxin